MGEPILARAYGNAWRSPASLATFVNVGPHPHWRFSVSGIHDLMETLKQSGWHANVLSAAMTAEAESALIMEHPNRSWQVMLLGEMVRE